MSYGKMLIHRCEILRHAENIKRGNFTKKGLVSIYPAGTCCRIVRKIAKNIDAVGRTKVSAYCILYLPKTIKVINGDVVIWSLDPDGTYTVQEPYAPSNRFHVVTIFKDGEI